MGQTLTTLTIGNALPQNSAQRTVRPKTTYVSPAVLRLPGIAFGAPIRKSAISSAAAVVV
jgi:hypothetical protein